MKYLNEIMWLVSWPLLIYFGFKLCELAIKKYQKKESIDEEEPLA